MVCVLHRCIIIFLISSIIEDVDVKVDALTKLQLEFDSGTEVRPRPLLIKIFDT